MTEVQAMHHLQSARGLLSAVLVTLGTKNEPDLMHPSVAREVELVYDRVRQLMRACTPAAPKDPM